MQICSICGEEGKCDIYFPNYISENAHNSCFAKIKRFVEPLFKKINQYFPTNSFLANEASKKAIQAITDQINEASLLEFFEKNPIKFQELINDLAIPVVDFFASQK